MEHDMKNNELWGPWVGTALKPSVPVTVRARRRRAFMSRLLIVLAPLSIAIGALIALSH
jgi:hypothetical protein